VDFIKKVFTRFLAEPESEMRDPLHCAYCTAEELSVKDKSGIKVYLCLGCGGSFLSQDSLNSLLNFKEEEWPELFAREANTEHTYDRSDETRSCPGCGDKMSNQQFWYTSGIWVDYCPNGHGIWLDSGEAKLLKEFRDGLKEEPTEK